MEWRACQIFQAIWRRPIGWVSAHLHIQTILWKKFCLPALRELLPDTLEQQKNISSCPPSPPDSGFLLYLSQKFQGKPFPTPVFLQASSCQQLDIISITCCIQVKIKHQSLETPLQFCLPRAKVCLVAFALGVRAENYSSLDIFSASNKVAIKCCFIPTRVFGSDFLFRCAKQEMR